MSLRLARPMYLVTLIALCTAYWLMPGVRTIVVAATCAASVGAIGLGLVRLRPSRWGAWLMIAGSVVLLTVGVVIFGLLQAGTPAPVAHPAAPAVIYLAAYPPLAAGLLWLGRPRLPSRDWPMIIDTAAFTLAGSLVVWIAIVRPAATSMQITGASVVTAIALWVAYVAVLSAAARAVLAWRINLALALLGAGVIALLVSVLLRDGALAEGIWSPLDVGVIVFNALSGAAALTPSMARTASAAYARHQLGPERLAMLAIALLVAPTALLAEATTGRVTAGVAIAVVSAAVGALLLVRLWLSLLEYGRRIAREQAARSATYGMVVAISDADVIGSLRSALTEMLPPRAQREVQLLERGGHPDAAVSPVAGTTDAIGELVALVPGAGVVGVEGSADGPSFGRAVVLTAPMADLVELSPIVEALAEQAGFALARIQLVARLQAQDRQRYFRTLVLTSTDVFLISRGGRVEYATPSARTMFGRDVSGENFDDLVDRVPSDQRSDATFDPMWSDTEDGVEGLVRRCDGDVGTVVVHRRDLASDPTVNGVVSTLRDVTSERDLQRELAYRASHDSLTGLVNSQTLHDELHAESGIGPHDRRELRGGLAVLYVDLDDFKTVNDTHGHEVGDGLLVVVARRIESCLRQDDVAARMGGDEFAVLLRDVPEAAARDVSQRIADVLAQRASVAGISVNCRASVGLAHTSRREEAETLLRDADVALYAAKACHGTRWCQYNAGMEPPMRQSLEASGTGRQDVLP